MRVTGAIVLAVLAWATPVLAQDVDALMEEGLELRRAGDDEGAVARFQLAYERGAGANALAQQALAEQALGRWLEAATHLEVALEDQTNRWVARHRRSLVAALEVIHRRLGQVEISGNVEGARVRVNGNDAGVLPLPAPVRVVAGSVIVEVEAEGYFTMQRPVDVAPERLARVEIVLVPRAPEPEPEPAPEPEPEPVREPVPVPIVPPIDETTYDWVLGAVITSYATAVVALAGLIAAAVIREINVLRYNEPRCEPVENGPSRLELCPNEGSALRTATDWRDALAMAFSVTLATGIGLSIALPFTPHGSGSIVVSGSL